MRRTDARCGWCPMGRLGYACCQLDGIRRIPQHSYTVPGLPSTKPSTFIPQTCTVDRGSRVYSSCTLGSESELDETSYESDQESSQVSSSSWSVSSLNSETKDSAHVYC
ncbi:hypothetical protein Bbelb_317310 [Branchiostoma belcheri]|nr:hypothetical protein Bbelb_317310 [Branchiostoma belcheri]